MSGLAKAATFIWALSIFQPLRLCVVGSSFAMKRFGYDEEAVTTFVPLTLNAMEILLTVAVLSTAAMTPVLKYSPWTKNIFPQIASGISIVVVCFPIAINTSLLKTYAWADDVDNVTRYYWLLLISYFATGMGLSWSHTIAGRRASSLTFGFSMSSFMVAIFHWAVIKILNSSGLDVDYWLLVSQIVMMLGLSIIAAVIWIAYLLQDKIFKAQSVTYAPTKGIRTGDPIGILRCMPMILGCALGLSVLWAAYPTIAPFQVAKLQYRYPIQRICLVVDAFSGIFVWLMDEYAGVQCDWYSGRNVWWHSFWLLFIPYLGIGLLFLRCMHYPESMTSRIVLSSPFVAGFLTATYYWLGRIVYRMSLVPVFVNAMGYGELVMALALVARQLSMNVLKYTAAAYVQQFRLAKEGLKAGKAWPTEGMSTNSAIRYWLKLGATVGYSNFKELATADVKQRLVGVARHVVSYRRAASSVA